MKQETLLRKLAARSHALAGLDAAPDDMLVDPETVAAILGRQEGGVRQAVFRGNFGVPAVKDGRNLRFRLGDVRAYVRRGSGDAR